MPERLPFHVLSSIFFAARDGNDVVEYDHGGELVSWDSTESALPTCTVCRGWLDAAIFTLYRSVAIIGLESANLLLRTLQARPERAALVRFLVVGVLHDDDEASDAEDQSKKLLEIIEACPLLLHLQIRPLHHSVRPRLLAAIRAKPGLTSLACLPRTDPTDESLYHETDLLELASSSPSLKYLEVDFLATPVPFTNPLPPLPPLNLIDFRSFSAGNDTLVLNLMKLAGATLVNVVVYFETLFPSSKAVADALAPSRHSLRTLSFLTNPTTAQLEDRMHREEPRLFDRILPSFLRLESLITSATECSSNIFTHLPPSLRHLEIHSLNLRPAFRFGTVVLSSLRDPAITFYLESFKMKEASWGDADVGLMRFALGSRRIGFEYLKS